MGIPTNGLVLYLPLYSTDLQGAPITSKDIYQRSCAVTGATWSYQGRTFDGNDKITLPSSSTLQNFTAKTVLFWFNPTTSVDYGYLFDGGYSTSTYGDEIYINQVNGVTRFGLRNTAGTFAAEDVTFTLDAWNLGGYSWDGANVTYYKNGVATGSVDALTGTLACSSVVNTIGRKNDNTYGFIGTKGELLIYNLALTAGEFLQIYNETIRTYYACWDFAKWG